MQVEEGDLAYGEGDASVERDPKEGARHGDGVLGCLLAEVLEGREGARHRLDLIEDDEGRVRVDRLAGGGGYARQDPVRVERPLEQLDHGRIVLQAHVGHVLEAGPSELLQDPGLAHLAGATQNQGLPTFVGLPGPELFEQQSLHFHLLTVHLAVILRKTLFSFEKCV